MSRESLGNGMRNLRLPNSGGSIDPEYAKLVRSTSAGWYHLWFCFWSVIHPKKIISIPVPSKMALAPQSNWAEMAYEGSRLGYIKSDRTEAVECKMKDGEKYLWLVTLLKWSPWSATGVSKLIANTNLKSALHLYTHGIDPAFGFWRPHVSWTEFVSGTAWASAVSYCATPTHIKCELDAEHTLHLYYTNPTAIQPRKIENHTVRFWIDQVIAWMWPLIAFVSSLLWKRHFITFVVRQLM